MGDKASPDMVGRLLEDRDKGGRGDRNAGSCITGRRKLLKKSVTLVLVASGSEGG